MQETDFVNEVLCDKCSWRFICLTACKEVNEVLVRIEETFAQELKLGMQQRITQNKSDILEPPVHPCAYLTCDLLAEEDRPGWLWNSVIASTGQPREILLTDTRK